MTTTGLLRDRQESFPPPADIQGPDCDLMTCTRRTPLVPRPLLVIAALATAAPRLTAADTPTTKDPSALEFFERAIRPLLVDTCQACPGEKKDSGGLRLTGRPAALQGGDGGPALVP